MKIFEFISDFLLPFIDDSAFLCIFLNNILIFSEPFLPFLPGSIFISLNFIKYGSILGFLITYIFMICGSFCSFIVMKKLLKNIISQKFFKKKNFIKFINFMSSINLSYLVLIISLPFTSSFLLNICCGIANMDNKKYLISILIGKLVFIYFWGFVGLCFLESFSNPISILKVLIMIVLSYILSVMIKNKFNIN